MHTPSPALWPPHMASNARMRALYLLHASVSSVTAPAPAPGGVGQLGYGITIAVGVLLLISTVMLTSYICFRAKARAAVAGVLLVEADAPSAAVVLAAGLDGPAIDALYPKFFLRAAGAGSPEPDDKLGAVPAAAGPCAICLGEFAAGAALRRGPGCVHCFHAGCAERWLRVSATCPVCRDSPVPSPLATPFAEAAPLAAHARR